MKNQDRRVRILAVCLLVVCLSSVYGQKHLEILDADPQISPEALVAQFEAWSAGASAETVRRHRKHLQRWLLANADMYTVQGEPINYAKRIWNTHQKFQLRTRQNNLRSVNGDWIDYTPDIYTNTAYSDQGRTMCIAVHPDNPGTLYVGAGSGGLWRSVNGGNDWEQLTAGLPVLGVSSIAIDHTDPDVMYILTGECDGRVNPSIGILKSTDAGATWAPTAMTFDMGQLEYGFEILMHPDNPDTMLVATTNGIYRTYNGWLTMIEEGLNDFAYLEGITIYDLEFRPGSPNWVYASSATKVYRSNNLGEGWVNLTDNAAGLPTSPISTRIELAVTPAAPMNIYALHASDAEGNGYEGLYISEDGGNIWTGKTDMINVVGVDDYNQSTYNLVLAVDPLDPDIIYAGGIFLYKSVAAGDSGTWTSIDVTTHADKHHILINGTDMYLCTDGGVEYSNSGGAVWVELSDGLKIRQFYNVEVNTTHLMAGSQDNGTAYWAKGSSTGEHVLGGDGFQPFFHPTDPNIVYATTQADRHRSTTGPTGMFQDISPSTYSDGIWQAPWILHPTNPDTIYSAVNNGLLTRSMSGGDSTSWQTIDSGYADRLTTLAQGVSDPDVMYAATLGEMRISTNVNDPTPVWDTITNNLPVDSAGITDIAVDPANANQAWVVFRNFAANHKVYHTTNQGASWINYGDGLPNVRVWSIVYQTGSNHGLYIGTDIGVFYRNASMAGWEYFSNGLPNVPVYDLKIQGGHLYAATHGNGIWRSDLSSPCPNTVTLTPATAPYGTGDVGIWVHEAIQSVVSSVGLEYSIGTDITCRAGDFVRMDPGFEIKAGNTFEAQIGGCDN